MLLRSACVLAALGLCSGLAAQPISIRDAGTGAFLDASLVCRDALGRDWPLAVDGRQHRLPGWDGLAQCSARAVGYRDAQASLHADATAVQWWLDPASPSHRPAPDPGQLLLDGFVYRAAQALPLAGVRVSFAGFATQTDASGYFRLELPADRLADDGSQSRALHFSGHGLAAQRQVRAGGGLRVIVDLDAPGPTQDHRFDGATLQATDRDAWGARQSPAPGVASAPPATIRVGFADAGFSTPCCGDSCPAVSVMSLETYVRRGLNDEWIASWSGESLRAGAIAYRSYGAWHVLNPRTPAYDICSSACCQVNDADTSTSTNSAVTATAGILLERNATIFRSEYSAENNAWDDPGDGLPCSNADLSCGNGSVGSPATNWPCMADSVALDRGCFGHGRGMSQWGTQRWATNHARRWPWIVDHYYNDNGNASGAGSGLRTATMSSPLRIDNASVPALAQPGSTISIQLQASNLAAEGHTVRIGASLFRSGAGFVSDPPNDIATTLDPGTNARSRPFALPPGLAPGLYDLWTALYLDIDGNGAINSGDLALAADQRVGVLQVGGDALFANGFEP